MLIAYLPFLAALLVLLRLRPLGGRFRGEFFAPERQAPGREWSDESSDEWPDESSDERSNERGPFLTAPLALLCLYPLA